MKKEDSKNFKKGGDALRAISKKLPKFKPEKEAPVCIYGPPEMLERYRSGGGISMPPPQKDQETNKEGEDE